MKLIMKADKDNVTVVLNRADYVHKMEVILSDINTYQRITRDPTKKLTSDLLAFLLDGKILNTDSNSVRVYGLPKKPGNPLRVIVSSINSLLYYFSLFLHNIIHGSIIIFSSIRMRIKIHFNKIIKKQVREYNKTISESFSNIAKSVNLKPAFTIPNTLKKYITTGKDTLERTVLVHHNVIYKNSCHDCDASYIGQRKRQLKTRIAEHSSNINKKSGSPSVISNHQISLNHNFD
ncbi:hypothetical protein ALC56_08095 [Trachymyrmex septentrionalis]|uniref:GIY-YIG domain-containing protein n=1 Tax=Trachymyrmex septentrionalis TaxID=34720 RepID=A0A151JW32_9HYME|nr:hypothetical protein ALC56_08095 [Trachymyrmex septentrionalis]